MPYSARTNARSNASETIVGLQQAFKLALSLTLFYGFALWTNWDVPKYGALAIVIVSLGTIGASIEQGMMRVVGTTCGVVAGVFYIALFSHDRIAMLLALSIHIAVIGYFMQSSRYPYAWYVAAFVPLTVWGDNYPQFESAFYFGTFRWLETTVGVLIWTMVDLVLWPRHAGDQLGPLGQSYISSVRKLIESCREQSVEHADSTAAQQASVSDAISQLATTLKSAYVDTPAVNSQQHAWELWMENARVFASALGQLGESIARLNELEQLTSSGGSCPPANRGEPRSATRRHHHAFSKFAAKCQKLVSQPETELDRWDRRLERIGVLWTLPSQADDPSDDDALVEHGTIELNDSEIAKLNDSARALVRRYLQQLQRCEQASCNLLRVTRVLVGLDSAEQLPSSSGQQQEERPATTGSAQWIRALLPPTALMATCFFWIFWNPPTGATTPMLAGILALVVLRTSVNPIAAWMALLCSALLVVTPIYWLVMPGLSRASELLALIFLYAFFFRYLGGRWPVLKSCPIIMFVVMTGISNQQQYSFQVPVDGALMVLLAGTILTAVYYLCAPLVPHPSTKPA